MRFQLLAALATLSALAVAQYNGLPKCAQACVGNSLVDYGCGNIQAECICKNAPLISALACCVGKSCTSQQDISDTETFAAAICKPYDVTLPASPTCPSGTSSTLSATGGTSSPTTASTAAGALVTGGAGSNSANGTANAAGTSTTPSSSTTPASTGGAPMQTMAAGLGAAAMGLLAVL